MRPSPSEATTLFLQEGNMVREPPAATGNRGYARPLEASREGGAFGITG